MALIKCKECGREISASAESCPHCGYKTKQGQAETENRTLQIKLWIYTGMFLLGLILFVTNVGTLFDRYEEWETVDGIIRDIWGSTRVNFLEYLDAYDDSGALWASIIGVILIPWGGGCALIDRSHYKSNKIEAANEKILYGLSTQGNGQAQGLWTCASCGQVNVERVEICQACGITRAWSEEQRKKLIVMQDEWKCPACGRVNERYVASGKEVKFCTGCGAKLRE